MSSTFELIFENVSNEMLFCDVEPERTEVE